MRLGNVCLLTCVGFALSPAWIARADTPAVASAPAKYELPAIPDDFKDADAVILSWDQKWTVAPDGSITQHETKRVLIKHDRAIGAFADPRITYNKDWQTVKVLVARTITPDGRAMDVPEYSRNTVAPSESAGWPAFAAIQQLVLTYSAIEPGAILELEWERVTKPGMKSSLEIDEVVETGYPCLARTFDVSGDKSLNARFQNVPAVRDEPQSLSADEECRWFQYPDPSNGQESVKSITRQLARMDEKSKRSDHLTSVVKDWCKDKSGDIELASEIHSRIGKSLSIVHPTDSFVPDSTRSLEEVLKSRYATPRETQDLMVALFREAGLEGPSFVVMERHCRRGPRSAIDFTGMIVPVGGKETYWNAERGQVFPDSSCDPRTLYRIQERGIIGSPQWARSPSSTLNLSGAIQVAADGKWTGRFTIDATRVFRRGRDLRTEDNRRGFAAGILERIAPASEITSTSVASLGDDRVEMTVEAKSRESLATVDGHRFFLLPTEGAWLRDISLPMRISKRERAMRIADAFSHSLKLTIENPKDWTLTGMPRTLGSKDNDKTSAYQHVESTEGRITLDQRVQVPQCIIDPADYPRIRSALSELQTESARTFIWKAPADSAQKVN